MAPTFYAWHTYEFRFDAQAGGKLVPQSGELACFIHQHMVTHAQGVDQCCLPRTCARSWVNHHRMLRLKNLLHVSDDLVSQHSELRSTVINRGQTHGAQNAIRYW